MIHLPPLVERRVYEPEPKPCQVLLGIVKPIGQVQRVLAAVRRAFHDKSGQVAWPRSAPAKKPLKADLRTNSGQSAGSQRPFASGLVLEKLPSLVIRQTVCAKEPRSQFTSFGVALFLSGHLDRFRVKRWSRR